MVAQSVTESLQGRISDAPGGVYALAQPDKAFRDMDPLNPRGFANGCAIDENIRNQKLRCIRPDINRCDAHRGGVGRCGLFVDALTCRASGLLYRASRQESNNTEA
jgi:hypothetical protein